jgi:hypothetical protein
MVLNGGFDMTVFNVLREIETRPGMFIGLDSQHRAAQLRALEALLHGYSLALSENGVDEPGIDFLRGLAAYMAAQGWKVGAIGPIATIVAESPNSEVAWRVFWKLVWEFEAKLNDP